MRENNEFVEVQFYSARGDWDCDYDPEAENLSSWSACALDFPMSTFSMKRIQSSKAFPSKVVIAARGQWSEGMAVNLRIHMKRKNDYNLIVFLDRRGRAEVSRKELLRSVREDGAAFPMDYVGLASAYGGRLTARVLGAGGVDRALQAHSMFKEMCRYPAGYRKALLRARQLPAPKRTCSVGIKRLL